MIQFTEYKLIKIKDFTSKYSQNLWNQIKQHANGSFYKLNSGTADCYTFCPVHIDNRLSWEGGWDWTSGIIDDLEYLYNFNDGKLYQLK